MSTTIDTPAPATGTVGETSSRGRLVLEKRVIERVASQAASESLAAGGTSGGLFGFGAKGDLSARPTASVELAGVGRSATLRLDLTIAYPAPIREATDQVREHVTYRVHELTGVQVTRVDITVTGLHHLDATGGRIT